MMIGGKHNDFSNELREPIWCCIILRQIHSMRHMLGVSAASGSQVGRHKNLEFLGNHISKHNVMLFFQQKNNIGKQNIARLNRVVVLISFGCKFIFQLGTTVWQRSSIPCILKLGEHRFAISFACVFC